MTRFKNLSLILFWLQYLFFVFFLLLFVRIPSLYLHIDLYLEQIVLIVDHEIQELKHFEHFSIIDHKLKINHNLDEVENLKGKTEKKAKQETRKIQSKHSKRKFIGKKQTNEKKLQFN